MNNRNVPCLGPGPDFGPTLLFLFFRFLSHRITTMKLARAEKLRSLQQRVTCRTGTAAWLKLFGTTKQGVFRSEEVR